MDEQELPEAHALNVAVQEITVTIKGDWSGVELTHTITFSGQKNWDRFGKLYGLLKYSGIEQLAAVL